MKNKKRIKFGILIATIIAIAIIGTIGVKKMNEPTEKERQIAFLKEHEEEMTEYIKEYSVQDEQIVFDWDTVTVDTSSAFSKPVLTIKFDISDSSESVYNNQGYVLRIKTDVKKLEKIDGLTVLNDPIYSSIQEDIND
ncbi:hypothetical protein HRF80_09055 [Enterococcus faecalis]|uniref:hypothetical protein n=1 Tax=Enterococcus TaxID=1350 RepID=UPI0003A3ED9B|nr:hypothetical protein [Enterococcus faecalis]EGO8079515.1 hypothetical protein [Enterococcus faecalis]EJI7157069.1 hypothetical protein [Enterococcus faecalis]ELU9007890.1 hypothetical protein [Enterococcus faecalis]MDK0527241.1 hypothetical protein [Enterococcus faecalis]NSR45877.1 hypothetical protein [Enterococcus faecalis]